MIKKHKKVCMTLNYMENLPTLLFTITECVSISVFAWLACIPISITSSTVRLIIRERTAGTKNCNSITKKRRKMHNKIVLLAKAKLNIIEVLFSI